MAVDKLVDSYRLDTDLTSVANAIRTKGGTSASLAFPSGFVTAIGNIPTGGGTLPLTQFGHYFQTTYLTAEATLNHVKISHRSGGAGNSIALNNGGNLSCPEWFKINAGSTVTITYKNVVNPSGIDWNANFKRADSTTSLSFGIGNGAHLSGATVTVTPSTDQSVGCMFFYVTLTSGNYIECDVEITVDGVRYI